MRRLDDVLAGAEGSAGVEGTVARVREVVLYAWSLEPYRGRLASQFGHKGVGFIIRHYALDQVFQAVEGGRESWPRWLDAGVVVFVTERAKRGWGLHPVSRALLKARKRAAAVRRDDGVVLEVAAEDTEHRRWVRGRQAVGWNHP